MLEFDCANYGKLSERLISFRVYVEDVCKDDEKEVTAEELREGMLRDVTLMLEICEESQLRDCCYQLGVIKSRLESKDHFPTFKVLCEDIKYLEHTAFLETAKNVFLIMPAGKVEFYKEPELFGRNVADRLTAASYDIEQAGNCFALGQHTASVMHLMRALEVAMDALGRGLSLPSVVVEAKHSWTKVLKNIFDQIGVLNRSSDPTWTPDKAQFFEDARAHLFAVKRSWRDASMHLDKKYEEHEAKRILNAVKDFMEHLAEHLDEAGIYTP